MTIDIKKELRKIDFQIQELAQQKLTLEKKFINEQCKRDIKTFIKHYDKLMSIYNAKHPKLYDKIIVSCFPIRTTICCGIGGAANKITLGNLLKLWSSGYTYKGRPITNITVTNSGRRWLSYLKKDGSLGHISNKLNWNNTKLIQKYEKIPFDLFGPAPWVKEKYSLTCVSDLFNQHTDS